MPLAVVTVCGSGSVADVILNSIPRRTRNSQKSSILSLDHCSWRSWFSLDAMQAKHHLLMQDSQMRGTGKETNKSQTRAHEVFLCVWVSLSAEKVERWAEE